MPLLFRGLGGISDLSGASPSEQRADLRKKIMPTFASRDLFSYSSVRDTIIVYICASKTTFFVLHYIGSER